MNTMTKRRVRRQFDAKFIADVVERSKTEKVSKLSEELDIDRSSIDRWRKKAGILTKTKGSHGKYPQELRESAVRRVQAGEKAAEVAASLGIDSRQKVHQWIYDATHKKKSQHKNGAVMPAVEAHENHSELSFCPRCGFHIAMLIKAVNAMAALTKS